MKRAVWMMSAAAAIVFSAGVQAVEIIGHRGASYDAPENTLASMRLAFEQGADAAELDIHLTKDGKIAVIHDADLKRVGGVELKVADSTLAELRRHNVGRFDRWKDKPFEERVPELAEVLKIVPPGKKIYIEIKEHEEILPALAETIRASGLKPAQLPIITFYYDVAKAAKEKFPRHEVYWLHSYAQDKKTGKYPELDELIRKAREAKLDGLDLNFNFPIDRAFVDKVHSAGLKLCTWTVNDTSVARAEAAAGVDAITTDRPGWLRAELGRKQKQ